MGALTNEAVPVVVPAMFVTNELPLVKLAGFEKS
jgi:hypothetical protein